MGGEEESNAMLANASTETESGTVITSSNTSVPRVVQCTSMIDGTGSSVEFEIDTEAITKAYKEELVHRMDAFWDQQLREVGVYILFGIK